MTWLTLAEPTHGVREHGTAIRLEAGTLLQPYDAKGVDPGTGCGVKRGPEGTSTFLFRDAEGWDEPDLVYLTASALRFEGDPEPAEDPRWEAVRRFMEETPQAMPADPLGPVPGSARARFAARRRRA